MAPGTGGVRSQFIAGLRAVRAPFGWSGGAGGAVAGAGRAGPAGCGLPCREGAFGWLLFVSEASIYVSITRGQVTRQNFCKETEQKTT